MPPHLSHVLSELEAWGQDNDAVQTEHGRKMLNLEPDTAQLISILVQSGHYKHLLEVGTSNGYSTIWLAWASAEVGGQIISIERDEAKHALAVTNLDLAGLRQNVTLHLGDASEIITHLPGPFDLVFLDANRVQYPALFELLLHRLSPTALILADNVHSHPDEIAPYLEIINAHPDFQHVVVGVGKGLSIALRRLAPLSTP